MIWLVCFWKYIIAKVGTQFFFSPQIENPQILRLIPLSPFNKFFICASTQFAAPKFVVWIIRKSQIRTFLCASPLIANPQMFWEHETPHLKVWLFFSPIMAKPSKNSDAAFSAKFFGWFFRISIQWESQKNWCFKGSDQWEGRGCRRSRNHYMLVGEVVLDVFFVILMGYHLVWTVIYCSASKEKRIVFAANNSRCYECHAAPTITLCFGLLALTIILNKVHILYLEYHSVFPPR